MSASVLTDALMRYGNSFVVDPQLHTVMPHLGVTFRFVPQESRDPSVGRRDYLLSFFIPIVILCKAKEGRDDLRRSLCDKLF